MFLLRPVRMEDHPEILGLAREAGIGMTSLPPDSHVLERKISRAVKSFAGKPDYLQGEAFLFVLEDVDSGRLVGTAGIVAHVGMQRPFHSYKLSSIVQASEKLGVYSLNRVLHMVNDYTGATEIGSLFLLPEWRQGGMGRFLSRSRFLMLAEFPELFSDTVIAEIRGVQNLRGESPFYNNLARHFFLMDFKRTDLVYATQGGQFIADLMPRYPIYVKLLAEEAQSVIGVPLEASRPAMKLLQNEGFSYEEYVDIFDAGPTLQAGRAQIRTVNESRRVPVAAVENSVEGTMHMICNTLLADFRVAYAPIGKSVEGIVIDRKTAKCLGVSAGDEVRYAL